MKNLYFRLYFAAILVLMLAGNLLPLQYAQASEVANPRIVINIPARKLWLLSGDTIIRDYPVGVGKANFPTPQGSFRVIDKVIDPEFENPFKSPGHTSRRIVRAQPLGTRWMGFLESNGGEYGIHGTNDPASVGKFSSHGCIRMNISDAEELFNLVDVDTPVDVQYETALVHRVNNEIRVVTFPDIFGRGQPSANDLLKRILERYPNAKVDVANLAQTLKKPTEKPIVIGNIPEEENADANQMLFKVRISN